MYKGSLSVPAQKLSAYHYSSISQPSDLSRNNADLFYIMDFKGLANAFRSKRLVYRAFEDNEADKHFLFAQIENDPVNTTLADLSMVQPRNKKQTDLLAKRIAESTLGVMICIPPGGDSKEDATPVPIGFLALSCGGAEQVHSRSTSLGIMLATPYQDQGYGKEAINWALDWAFRYGGYHRVGLTTLSYNERALHLYKQLGFVEEGRSRETYWHDRKWYDLVGFGILENEWAALRGLEET
ncbi:acyl-CoA N-acyltransferase [Ilyonectria robusta]|uniref:acyl-CoA N-acyltransferase n=1 Tax=Ilyonectria robusta TaxID=1079257 RepID=UPI001E8EB630|nr:acyl-CoA N-acyltransferase [Ilyonectria robusta]KAH8680214.1 acyl-CoA N-acyltransferase [Ilyonectria robusta]